MDKQINKGKGSAMNMDGVPTSLLREQIRVQAEYLFSPANLARDKKLRDLMDQDASRQGACPVSTILEHAPRLGAMVKELGMREHQNDGVPRRAGYRAFVSSVEPSKILVMNKNNGTVKRNVFLPAPPDLFDPEERPPPETDTPLPPPEPISPRRIHPRIWFEGVEGWQEEYHENPTASSRPHGVDNSTKRSKLVWRPVTEQERERFVLAEYVVKKLWVVDLPPSSGDARFPAIDQWDLSEFFMSADQLRRLEAKRQFAAMWRGQTESTQRLNHLRTGCTDPPSIPVSDPAGDKYGLPNLLAGGGDGQTIMEGEEMSWLSQQLKFWRIDENSRELDLVSHDLDPSKVPALAAFIGATRNCERVDIRANPRLTAQHGLVIANALLRNFNSTPSPKFLTSLPPLPPTLTDEDDIEDRVRSEGDAIKALRVATEGTADAAELGFCLQKCFDLGIQPNTDIERAQKAYIDRLSKVGTRCPNKGSILWFNNMSVHTLRSGTAKVVDATNFGLGATDITILLELLTAPFVDKSELESKNVVNLLKKQPVYRSLSPSLFIESLDLSGNEGMSDGGAGALAGAIGAHCLPVLKVLSLAGCGIGPEGFLSLSSALRLHGEVIEEIDLGQNRGGPVGLKEFVERFLFPRNTMPLFASARDVAAHCHTVGGSHGDMTEEERGYHSGLGGYSRPLKLKVLRLTQDVGNFTARGEDMSGVETLAACLVHPDAACENLDLLYLGGAPLPILHLRGELVERSSPEATAAAITFVPGKVDVPPDPFAAEQQLRYSEFSGPSTRAASRASSRQNQSRHSRQSRQNQSRTQSRGMLSHQNSSKDTDGGSGGVLNNSQFLDSNFRQVQFTPLIEEEVKRSDVRNRLKERLERGCLLHNKSYPSTAEIAGAQRGTPLTEINLSLQGTVISVEDAIVIAALVEENDHLKSLILNSHRPLPIKQLRGDPGYEEEILDFSNYYWNVQEILVAARLLRHNRRVKTLRLCDNKPCHVAGLGAGSSYRQSGLGDLALTLTPPMQGLPGPQLSVVGRRPPRGAARRRGGGDMAHLVGVVAEDVLREGRPPLFDKTNWFTACRPDFVDLSNCGITGPLNEAPISRRGISKNNLTPAELLAPVLRGIYAWGLEHTLTPDSLVLIRKDKMSEVDAAIRFTEPVPKRLTSPYSPYKKERAKRGGLRHLNALPTPGNNN